MKANIKKIIQFILYTVMVLYLPCVLVASAFTDQSNSFLVFPLGLVFIVLILLTIGYLCIFLEVGFTLLRVFEEKNRSKWERILNGVTAFLCFALIVTAIIDPEANFITFTICWILFFLWLLGDIVFKQKKFSPPLFKKRSFWLSCTALFLTICVILALNSGIFIDRGQPDPLEIEESDTSYMIE